MNRLEFQDWLLRVGDHVSKKYVMPLYIRLHFVLEYIQHGPMWLIGAQGEDLRKHWGYPEMPRSLMKEVIAEMCEAILAESTNADPALWRAPVASKIWQCDDIHVTGAAEDVKSVELDVQANKYEDDPDPEEDRRIMLMVLDEGATNDAGWSSDDEQGDDSGVESD